jgi:chromosome partitioning protein
MITIAVANQKGGTGKTTTAVTLGHKLAQDHHRVLLVDTDVQGHVATALGLDKAPGIYQLVQYYQGVGQPLIVKARPRLDVVPSDKATEPAKRILVSMNFRERILADTLSELDYDVVVVDCAPSVDVLHMAALVAADWLIVPTRLDYLAVDGVNEVIGSLSEIQRRSPDSAPAMLGVLPTFYDRQTNETMAQLKILVDAFGKYILPPVPVDTKLREAPAFGQTIWEYAPTSRSVIGVPSANGRVKHLGGYAQFVERVKEVMAL